MLTYAADGTVSQPESTKKKLGDRLPLSKGAKGDDVKELQNALLALDQTLPKYGADGDFGSETQKAVAAFQAAKGLNQTGALDEATYKALTDALNAPKEPDGNVPMTRAMTPFVPSFCRQRRRGHRSASSLTSMVVRSPKSIP